MPSAAASGLRPEGGQEHPAERPRQEPKRPERGAKESDRERQPEAGQGDPISASNKRKKNSSRRPGLADFDSQAKARSAELHNEMKRASQKIVKDPARMRAAESEGFVLQIKNFERQAEKEHGREKGKGTAKDEGLERYKSIRRDWTLR